MNYHKVNMYLYPPQIAENKTLPASRKTSSYCPSFQKHQHLLPEPKTEVRKALEEYSGKEKTTTMVSDNNGGRALFP